MDGPAAEHRRTAPERVRCAVITVSDTRTIETDLGGRAVVGWLEGAGHEVVFRQIVSDEPGPLAALLNELRGRSDVEAVLLTGGTGVASRDHACEVVSDLLSKPLPGYGELFRLLSYQQVGAAAMLSRTVGGVMGRTVVLTMPGSPAAVRLAMEKLIIPELAHLVREARR